MRAWWWRRRRRPAPDVGLVGPPASPRGALRHAAPGLIPVPPVVPALRAQLRREGERVARLAVAAEELERAAPAEEGVVVGGRAGDDRLELRGRLGVALRVEERAAQ